MLYVPNKNFQFTGPVRIGNKDQYRDNGDRGLTDWDVVTSDDNCGGDPFGSGGKKLVSPAAKNLYVSKRSGFATGPVTGNQGFSFGGGYIGGTKGAGTSFSIAVKEGAFSVPEGRSCESASSVAARALDRNVGYIR